MMNTGKHPRSPGLLWNVNNQWLASFTHSLNAWLLHVKPLYCPKSAKLGCIPDIKAEGLAFGGVNSLSV